jgi:hypothetical protein
MDDNMNWKTLARKHFIAVFPTPLRHLSCNFPAQLQCHLPRGSIIPQMSYIDFHDKALLNSGKQQMSPIASLTGHEVPSPAHVQPYQVTSHS